MPREAQRTQAPRLARGGILLELLLAIAIFAATAMFVLSAMRSALDGMRRAELRARAADLAATRLVELDAGLVSVGDLGDEAPERADAEPSSAGDAELVVDLEILDSSDGDATIVRATVRDLASPERSIVAVRERVVDGFRPRVREPGR